MEDSRHLNPMSIGGQQILPGEQARIELEVAKLFDYTKLTIPVEIIRSKQPGPTLFVSAAIHGDELNGVEIIKRLLKKKNLLKKIKGTLIAVPVVNIFGFNRNMRYLPDKRDLNRCFPGSTTGSLGGQIANIFMKEIVAHATHGIDFHTGSNHRTNLPQIRALLDSEETRRLALAFGVPVVLNSTLRDGSLRQAVAEKGIPMLLFEGGESLRYQESIIRSGLRGLIAVMNRIGMLDQGNKSLKQLNKEAFVARSSFWVRAPHSGSVRIKKTTGSKVTKGEVIGVITNPFGSGTVKIEAPRTGIIIGINLLPLVNNGDAIFHIALFENASDVEDRVEIFEEFFENED